MKGCMNILLSCCLLWTSATAQKHDNVWPGGFTEYPNGPNQGNFLLRFDLGTPTVIPTDLNMNFESTVAAFSDSAGQLLYYTNGCKIANAQGQTLALSNDMNPGAVKDLVCDETGYISPFGAMFLPWPGKEKTHVILLHMAVDDHPDRKLTYGPFQFSIIFNAGPGIVQAVNEPLLEPVYAPSFNYRTYEPFSVVRHGNGRDWWIIVPEYRKNRYNIFLLSTNLFTQYPTQTIGQPMSCRRIGASAFSPDGSKFARQQNCGVTVMDFDRCTGRFSNPAWLSLPDNTFGGGGVAFSADGNDLITAGQLCVYRADLTTSNPVFDTLISATTLAGHSLHYCQRGPDGNLYFSELHRSRSMPVLNSPFDDPLNFESDELQLDKYLLRGLPNFPAYRLYDATGSQCDTLGINTPVPTAEPFLAGEAIRLWPNPGTGQFYLALPPPEKTIHSMTLTDILGRSIAIEYELNAQTCKLNLPNDQAAGLYFLHIIGDEKRQHTIRLVVAK